MSFFTTLAEPVVPLAGIMKRKVIGDSGQRAVKKVCINDLDLNLNILYAVLWSNGDQFAIILGCLRT